MKDKNSAPPVSQFGQLVAFLAQTGMGQQAAQNVLGAAPNGRTRQQIADELREWLKTRPKA